MYNMKQVAHITTIIIPAIYTSLCVGIVMFPWNEELTTSQEREQGLYISPCVLEFWGLGPHLQNYGTLSP